MKINRTGYLSEMKMYFTCKVCKRPSETLVNDTFEKERCSRDDCFTYSKKGKSGCGGNSKKFKETKIWENK